MNPSNDCPGAGAPNPPREEVRLAPRPGEPGHSVKTCGSVYSREPVSDLQVRRDLLGLIARMAVHLRFAESVVDGLADDKLLVPITIARARVEDAARVLLESAQYSATERDLLDSTIKRALERLS